MTDYSVISRYRNKIQCELLVEALRARGKSCYNFCEVPADPNNPDASPDDQMRAVESDNQFYDDPHLQRVFKRDLDGLKNAEQIILLLPAGTSAHIEAGIAYGLGKPLILIGEPEKAESLYLIFQERYPSVEAFLATINSGVS